MKAGAEMFRDKKKPGRWDLKHFRNQVQYHSLNFLSFSICMFLSFFVCQSWRCIDILWIYYVLNDLTLLSSSSFDLNKHFVQTYSEVWLEFFVQRMNTVIRVQHKHTHTPNINTVTYNYCFKLIENFHLGHDSFRLDAHWLPLCWTQISL